MANQLPYAKFLGLLSNLKQQNPDSDFDGCDEILAHLALKASEPQKCRITHLVQSMQFGTGPTVHKKVGLLAERNLISVVPDPDDGRAKLLSLTTKGSDYLAERSKLLKLCV